MSSYYEEEARIRKRAFREDMRILVWGPGDPGASASPEKQAAYQKRLQIKQALADAFDNCEVHFSEDKEMIDLTGHITGQLRRQAVQARIADVVIMLDLARGVDLEADHFILTYDWFRDKAFVFLPEEYVPTRGLVRNVFDRLPEEHVYGFTDAEFTDCVVAKVKAVNFALSIAMDRLL